MQNPSSKSFLPHGSQRVRSRSRSPPPEYHYHRKLQAREHDDMRSRNSGSEDERALRSLYCDKCDVTQHDRESMIKHLNGKQHLKQLRRIKDNDIRKKCGGKSLSEVLVLNSEDIDENYWKKNKGPRMLMPDQERFLDTARFDNIPAKFDSKTYDNGQYRCKEDELFCKDCCVWTRSRVEMENHKNGANHQKRLKPVQRFHCDLCQVEVTCQVTLNNHMKGRDHLKRKCELMEKRKRRGQLSMEDDEGGYKTGPLEMAQLNKSDCEELANLRVQNKNLQHMLKEYQEKFRKCDKELKAYKKWCQEEHKVLAKPENGEYVEENDMKFV